MKRFLEHTLVQYFLAISMVAVAVLCVFTPDLFILKQSANFTAQIMLLYLLASMGLLLFRQERLMFVALACCGLLCLHLRSASDQRIKFPSENTSTQISVANVNLSLSEDYASTMHTVWSSDVDVISFQEYTPDWRAYLTEQLSERYPYQSHLTRIDPYGIAIFSKYPLSEVDTFIYEEIPNLHAQVKLGDDQRFHIISAHTMAPVNSAAYGEIRLHFQAISDFMSALDGPIIMLGDLNIPSWSEELKEFKSFASLNDSRRDIGPASVAGTISLLKIPIDHIMYSQDVECTAFQVLTNASDAHLGIFGRYQLKEFASLQ